MAETRLIKGRPSRPTKQKVTRRRSAEEDYDDEYDDDDYEDEKPVPRKAKGKGGRPRRKRLVKNVAF
ncbi:hypothetical protein KAM622c_42290 [Klebsiella quasipneumoniae subsp. quasipneumoniae]|nr:hypothetical protein KAM622c_42290 [Klebsiella quasipneumoniae subsp. quasipneumoniae]